MSSVGRAAEALGVASNEAEALLQQCFILAAILDLVLVLVFCTNMLFSFSQILVTSICDSFTSVVVHENSNRF